MRNSQAGPIRQVAGCRRLLACSLVGALILGQAGALAQAHAPAQADAAPAPEENVKAAFIFNFAVFTEWPLASLAPGAPLTLCTYPGNSLQAALAGLNDKLVNGHPLQVRLLGATARLRACHIVVLGNGDRERWGQARKELADASILTVADETSIGDDGAVITLGVENRRIGFDVALAAARQARVVLSSKLLRLARSVQ
ncbi:MAG: YfiR family protein [Massilia sp.]|nr:YfiR family protein [Massilia sp.]